MVLPLWVMEAIVKRERLAWKTWNWYPHVFFYSVIELESGYICSELLQSWFGKTGVSRLRVSWSGRLSKRHQCYLKHIPPFKLDSPAKCRIGTHSSRGVISSGDGGWSIYHLFSSSSFSKQFPNHFRGQRFDDWLSQSLIPNIFFYV